MKRLFALLLATLFAVCTFSAGLPVTAEAPEADEPRAFVIDGKLDPWYRDDDWAKENGAYYYYNSPNDANMQIISADFSQGNGELPLDFIQEEVTVRSYAAYDDHYIYFYVEVHDSDIASSLSVGGGEPNPHSSQLENINFWVDTDVLSASTNFAESCQSLTDADTHFRIFAHDMLITDAHGEVCTNKFTFTGETDNNPQAYFNNPANVCGFQLRDDNGALTGYGCEARFPLARYYDPDGGWNAVYYNIAVNNHPTEKDPLAHAFVIGPRWWLAYDTGAVLYLEDEETNNPFLYKDETMAAEVNAQIDKLPEADQATLSHRNAVYRANADFNGLSDAAKELVGEARTQKLQALMAKMEELEGPDISEPESTPSSSSGSTPSTSTGSTPSQSTGTPGDVTGDGKVNAADALAILRYAVHKTDLTAAQQAVADLNGDKAINAADALAVLRKAVGK